MSALTVQVTARPSDVRAFLTAQGIEVGTRGKFSAEHVKAYNKVNPIKYVPAKYVPVREVTVTDKRGRKVVRKANPAAARALLKANGIAVGERGRLTAEQYRQAYALAIA